MRRRSLLGALVVLLLPWSFSLASQVDGVTLFARRAPGQADVTLEWTGGQTSFHVYRSTNRALVVAPGNLLGDSLVRSWVDTPPAGSIFYYEIRSDCVYGPPELCDGLDNDCDGTIDEAGSEASCNLANATAACSGGACVVASCNLGFGDCNGLATDGCETSTNVAQSTSPQTVCNGADCAPNADLRSGYVRVTGIANCGGCGITCDDGIACTTDLCVPVSGQGTCRYFNRAQCAGARCGNATLPPGTPPPSDPACTGVDADGDGLGNAWETPQTDPYTGAILPVGVDINCDGVISAAEGDLVWHEAPSGDGTKDIYLEYDYMVAGAGETEDHAPIPAAVAQVVTVLGNHDITLHVDPVHEALAHASVLYLPVTGPDSCAVPGNKSLYDPIDYKGNPSHFDPRRRYGYHYFIFAHDSCCDSCSPTYDSSGIAEIIGNDGIVSLGDFPYAGTPATILDKRIREQAGTMLHEVGHNLGLRHGGTDDVLQKPNYFSVMNYRYQFSGIQRAATPGTTSPLDAAAPQRVDFSSDTLHPLVEASLDETVGVNIPATATPRDRDIVRYPCPGGNLGIGPGRGPVDWNCDGSISPMVAADINLDGTVGTLSGSSDWGSLDFNFQCQPTVADGAQDPARVARTELTLALATSRYLRACDVVVPSPEVCDGLDNDCDGLVDEAGSEASCNLAHATSACTAGSCVIAACDPGFGNCDGLPADGCETPLDAIPNCGSCGQTCYDGSACTVDACVAGACRNIDQRTCRAAPTTGEGGVSCTTLPLPAGCWGTSCTAETVTLPAGCEQPDSDGDGLPDAWEMNHAIDGNCDGDFTDLGSGGLDVALPDDPDWDEVAQKNAYVVYDYMETDGSGEAQHEPVDDFIGKDYDAVTDAPVKGTLTRVKEAFASKGIRLKIEKNTNPSSINPSNPTGITSPLPHYDVVTFAASPGACATNSGANTAVSFYGVKSQNFEPRLRFSHKYLLFAHSVHCEGNCSSSECIDEGSSLGLCGPVQEGTTGLGELRGNDFIVTLGGQALDDCATCPEPTKTAVLDRLMRFQAGTVTHEFGHTFGLDHGGANEPGGTCAPNQQNTINRKPNYISVMQYALQITGIRKSETTCSTTPLLPVPSYAQLDPGEWRVDYSSSALSELAEGALMESDGVAVCACGLTDGARDISLAYRDCDPGVVPIPGCGGVDWNRVDGVMDTVGVDINQDRLDQTGVPCPFLGNLSGFDDWTHVRANMAFQCGTNFADGSPSHQFPATQEAHEQLLIDMGLKDGWPLEVAVEVQPGQPNVIPLAGTFIAAVMGSSDLDVSNIDPPSLRFAGAVPVESSVSDANGDGYLDLKGRFRTADTLLTLSSTRATTTGVLYSSRSIYGSASFTVVPSTTCNPGFGDCDGNPANGCETDLQADSANCGSCGNNCGALFCTTNATCQAAVCVGTPRDCSTGIACTTGTCNETTDSCEQACSGTPCWVRPLGTGVASAPANDTGFHPGGGSYTYVAQGSTLYAVVSSTGAPAWTRTFPGTLVNFPNPVPLSAGGGSPEAIFVTTQDGFLYKLNPMDGSNLLFVDTRRAGHATDSILATPAVQLYAYSNSSFQSAMDSSGHASSDLVFVITRYPDDVTRNRVYAFYSDDLTVKWTYNADGNRQMDFGSEGCAIDYASNRLYCGTNLVDGSNLHSLFSFDTVNGVRIWSASAGSIQNRPVLANGKLYVATANGSIQKYDPNGNGSGGAAALWNAPVAIPNGVVRNVWPEFRAGTFQNKILALDSAGTLHAIVDQGTSGVVAWSSTSPASSWVSIPVVLPGAASSSAYIGRNDGKVQQLDTHDGTPDATVTVGGTTVYDPSLDVDGAGPDINRLTVVALDPSGTGQLTRICVPAIGTPPGMACHSDADCTTKTTACTLGRCNVPTGVCYGEPLPDGTACSDGRSCSLGDTCRSGVCLAQDYSTCPCSQVGDRACASGSTCCGSAVGCADLNTNPLHCGSCCHACEEDQICSQGVCTSNPAICTGGYTDAARLSAAAGAILGADALAYERTPSNVCGAYVSTYRTSPSSSAVARIDPSGAVATYPYTLDFTPLHGVAVPRQGDQIFAAFVNNGPSPSFTPGLGLMKPPPFTLTRPLASVRTSGLVPFSDSRFNQGPVGPAFDWVSYNGTDGSRRTWFGNWSAIGDLYALAYPGSWTASPEPLWATSPNRITAIAFARRWNRQLAVPAKHRYLVLGHGTTLSLLDMDNAQRTDVNLANPMVYGNVSAILSIAVHPTYHDVYVEVKDTASQSQILCMSALDNSVRHLSAVQADFNISPVVPFSFPNEGRLCMTPAFELMRLVPTVNSTPLFQPYSVPR